MLDIKGLNARRESIIREMNKIKSMRKGTLNTQYRTVRHKNGESVENGPYYVLTDKVGGKTVSKSIPRKAAEGIQVEVDNYKRFRELSEEYIKVCESISVHCGADEADKKTEFRVRIRMGDTPLLRENASESCEW